MGHESENQLTGDLRKVLQHSVDTLDVEANSRLRRARAQAIEEATQQRWYWHSGRTWVAIPLLLVLALATVILEQRRSVPDSLPLTSDALQLQDYPMLTSTQDLQLLEDLEFYLWLEEYVEEG